MNKVEKKKEREEETTATKTNYYVELELNSYT